MKQDVQANASEVSPHKEETRDLSLVLDGPSVSRMMFYLSCFRKSTPHDIVNLLYTIANMNNQLMVSWGS